MGKSLDIIVVATALILSAGLFIMGIKIQKKLEKGEYKREGEFGWMTASITCQMCGIFFFGMILFMSYFLFFN